MIPQPPPLTLGIEEEYLLVDRRTFDLVSDPPEKIVRECSRRSPGQVAPEFLRSQIEIGTAVCGSIAEARADLTRLRRGVIEVADSAGLAPIAASTHPYGRWAEQMHSPVRRYRDLADEMQAAARRLLICGMHVHVGVDNDELRIDLMNQLRYFLPHLLALSTSSPFWEGQDTGLKSYRLTIFDALPRTGLPQHFESHAEFQRHVDVLIDAGLLDDASKIWWDLRPSARYPTLETRIFDVCPLIEDAIGLAALTLCVTRMLFRLRVKNQRWRIYNSMLLNENRWRAMRYGIDEGLLDLAKGELVPFATLLDELIDVTEKDAEALDCTREIASLRDIVARGTSAHRQVAVYDAARADGADEPEALREVVRTLAEETARGAES